MCVCVWLFTYIYVCIYFTHTNIPAPVSGIAQVFYVTPARARRGRAHGAGAARAFVGEPLNPRADILPLNATGPVAIYMYMCTYVYIIGYIDMWIYIKILHPDAPRDRSSRYVYTHTHLHSLSLSHTPVILPLNATGPVFMYVCIYVYNVHMCAYYVHVCIYCVCILCVYILCTCSFIYRWKPVVESLTLAITNGKFHRNNMYVYMYVYIFIYDVYVHIYIYIGFRKPNTGDHQWQVPPQ